MRSFIAPVLAGLALAGCSVCAGTLPYEEPRHGEAEAKPLKRAAAKPQPKAAPGRRYSADALLDAVVVARDGKSLGRVEDVHFGGDGRIGFLTVIHGAEGTGTASAMLPFSEFKILGGGDEDYRVETALALKPLPEFTAAQ